MRGVHLDSWYVCSLTRSLRSGFLAFLATPCGEDWVILSTAWTRYMSVVIYTQPENIQVTQVFRTSGPWPAHLRDYRHTHVGHVGNDVTVLWWDVGMLKQLAQVLLTDAWHTQMDAASFYGQYVKLIQAWEHAHSLLWCHVCGGRNTSINNSKHLLNYNIVVWVKIYTINCNIQIWLQKNTMRERIKDLIRKSVFYHF